VAVVEVRWGFTGSVGEGGEEEVRDSCRFLRKERGARERTRPRVFSELARCHVGP
jgi:hypothetical protein